MSIQKTELFSMSTMAGKMPNLQESVMARDDSDSDGDEIIVYPSPQTFTTESNDEAPLDIELPYRSSRGWTKYKPSLRNFMPIRPLGSDESARIDQAGCLSFVTYSWVFSYLWQAFRGMIPRDQTWSCSIYDGSRVNMARLEFLWKEDLKKPRKKGPSLFRVVLRFFRTRLILASLIFGFCLAFGFIGPTCLVRALVAYAEKGDVNLHKGIGLVVALLVVELCRVLTYGGCWAISYRTGIRVRGAVLGFLFKKLVHLRGLKNKTAAEIVNLYANDGQRLFDAVTFAPLVLMGPTVLIAGLIYLLVVIGPWSLLGLLMFVIFDIFQYALGKTMVKYRKLAIAETEARVSMMGEILRCIKMIKMNAWEHPFMDKLYDIRNREKTYLSRAALAQSMAIAAGPVVPAVAAIATFLAYVGAGNDLSASDAFSAITVFFVMVFGIRMIPYGARYLAEAILALKNIQEFLLMTEADLIRPPPINATLALVIQDATFAWEESVNGAKEAEVTPLAVQEKTVLKGINLVVEKKQMIGICGPVGSGKSALLNAIIGQLVQQDGNILVSGNLAYCAQEPWIMNATVRDNILFGASLEDGRYYKVLTACGLNLDINGMPARDETEIGERGVTLSGGQKARISLARALYSNRDIYLLDDVLSSLDPKVSNHVFNVAIRGLLVGKTVLIVTSDVEHLACCQEIAYMENGRILDQGPHDELINRCKEYARFWDTSQKRLRDRAPSIENLLGGGEKSPMGQRSPSELSLLKHKRELRERSGSTLTGSDSLFDIPSAVDGQMIDVEEDLGLAAMSWAVYRRYVATAGGILVLTIVFVAFLANVGAAIFSTTWLSYWLKEGHAYNGSRSDDPDHPYHFRTMAEDPRFNKFSTIYGISLLLLVLTSAFKAYLWVKVSLRAASRLHNRMFNAIMHATMRFFDGTPSGRVLNRFSKDTDEVDVKLPFTAETFLQNMFLITAYLVVIAWVFPWFLIACVPLGAIFGVFVACFRSGIRSLKRSENISRSPLFEHISATLDGLPTIHAFNQTKRFLDTLKFLLDANSGAMFMFQSAMRWLAVWLDLLVVAVTVVTALLIVVVTGTESAVPPAYAGMALAFAIQMSGIFQFSVRMHTELEAKMTSVERMNYYIENVEDEGPWISKDYIPPLDWPSRGRISFRDVKLRYRENLPAALKGVSFDIRPQEKVGIVGRTGSGKSSLGVALFRMYTLNSGVISIDEIDVTTVGLHELRCKMEAIPQNPTLFAGTVRFNLDPLRTHTDDQLWEALDKTHLKDLFSGMEKGLDSEITEGGGNLSVGECQLLCMARALLRNVRILLLDEATASLDSGTDFMIHQCLREHFKECTLLIVAHRLSSVMHADKILFLDNGRVIEFDHPKVLMEDPKSRFYQMVKASSSETDQPIFSPQQTASL